MIERWLFHFARFSQRKLSKRTMFFGLENNGKNKVVLDVTVHAVFKANFTIVPTLDDEAFNDHWLDRRSTSSSLSNASELLTKLAAPQRFLLGKLLTVVVSGNDATTAWASGSSLSTTSIGVNACDESLMKTESSL